MEDFRDVLSKEEKVKKQRLFLMVFICQGTPELVCFCRAGSSEHKKQIRERI